MTAPFFTIITPTLQRDSLIEACSSVDRQTFTDWQHIVMVDCELANYELWDKIEHPNRQIIWCNEPHKNGGNTCRHNALAFAEGTWVSFCDDDNFYADHEVFRDIATALLLLPDDFQWAVFPITRLGRYFYSDPPRSCHIDTLNMVFRKEVALWPVTDAYGTDGIMADDLVARGVSYAAFPDFRPIGVIPKISFCK